MHSATNDERRVLIHQAVAILEENERGNLIRDELRTFLTGAVSSADSRRWRAVELLIEYSREGLYGSVLDALTPL